SCPRVERDPERARGKAQASFAGGVAAGPLPEPARGLRRRKAATATASDATYHGASPVVSYTVRLFIQRTSPNLASVTNVPECVTRPPSGSTMADTPVFVLRTRKRRCSIARNFASAR